MVKPRGCLLFFGPSNPGFGIYGKAWRAGLDLGPSDLGMDFGKA